MQSYSHKRGDTFSLAGPGTLPFAPAIARSQLRNAVTDQLIDNMDVTLTSNGSPYVNAEGNTVYPYLLALAKAPTSTALWPIGAQVLDVEFVDAGGVVRSTQTVQIKVIKDITRA